MINNDKKNYLFHIYIIMIIIVNHDDFSVAYYARLFELLSDISRALINARKKNVLTRYKVLKSRCELDVLRLTKKMFMDIKTTRVTFRFNSITRISFAIDFCFKLLRPLS